MNPSGLALAQAAARCIGAPFRLHGRDPASGVDCVGLLHIALVACGHPGLRHFAYALRNTDISDGLRAIAQAGLGNAHGGIRPGDVLLVRPGWTQAHLLIVGPGGDCIHAHAGLRRVVRTPAPLPWPVKRHWRLPAI